MALARPGQESRHDRHPPPTGTAPQPLHGGDLEAMVRALEASLRLGRAGAASPSLLRARQRQSKVHTTFLRKDALGARRGRRPATCSCCGKSGGRSAGSWMALYLRAERRVDLGTVLREAAFAPAAEPSAATQRSGSDVPVLLAELRLADAHDARWREASVHDELVLFLRFMARMVSSHLKLHAFGRKSKSAGRIRCSGSSDPWRHP